MRLFMAISVSRPVREYWMNRVRTMRQQIQGRSWVPFQNYHVTLQFLGNCTDVDSLCYAMQKTARHAQSIELHVHSIASIARSKSAMMVANVMDVDGKLQELYHDLRINFMDMGLFVEQKRFDPHITLARSLAKNAVECYVGPIDDCPSWIAHSFTLYDSMFVDGHMVYTPIHTQLLPRRQEIQPYKMYLQH